MKILIGLLLIAAGLVSFRANAESEYIFPTPFSEARCRWENKLGQTLHVYEGRRSPGYNVQNEQQCGLAIRALMLAAQGIWINVESFDGELEFRPKADQAIRCQTKTVEFRSIFPDLQVLEYRSSAAAQAATVEQLEAMRSLFDRHIKIVCEPDHLS